MERQRCATTFHSVPFGLVWFGLVWFGFVPFGNLHRSKRGELLQEPRAENNHSEGVKAITSLVPRLRILRGNAHNCATLSY